MFLRFVFKEIELERKGNQIRQEIVRNSLQILIDLGISSTSVYKKEFQIEFLKRTAQFYGTEAASSIGQMSCPEYLQMTSKKLKEEEDRCLSYLKEETKEPLMNAVHEVMISRHSKTLLEMDTSGLSTMIK